MWHFDIQAETGPLTTLTAERRHYDSRDMGTLKTKLRYFDSFDNINMAVRERTFLKAPNFLAVWQ